MYVIKKTISRLFGIFIKSHKENSVILAYDVIGNVVCIDSVKNKIFNALLILSKNVFINSDSDKSILELTKEKHNYITKQVAFMLRLINLSKVTTGSMSPSAYYHIFSSIDKITDIIKYFSNFLMQEYSDEVYAITKNIHSSISLFILFFNTNSLSDMVKFSNIRRRLREDVLNIADYNSNSFLGYLDIIMDLILDLFESANIVTVK